MAIINKAGGLPTPGPRKEGEDQVAFVSPVSKAAENSRERLKQQS